MRGNARYIALLPVSLGVLVLLAPVVCLAQGTALEAVASDGTITGRIVQMAAVLTFMSLLPALLTMTTCFTRFLIAFSFLRAGLGLQGSPANIVLISLALFMTYHVMEPTLDRAWQEGAKPLLDKKITEEVAFGKVVDPFKEFMRGHVREKDIRLFQDLAERNNAERNNAARKAVSEADLKVLVPAFMISELRRGFEIGFLIILPFLMIDLIVATVVMSMGMMMVSPTVFSLPCKVLFFILIDGWNLLVGGMVRSFF